MILQGFCTTSFLLHLFHAVAGRLSYINAILLKLRIAHTFISMWFPQVKLKGIWLLKKFSNSSLTEMLEYNALCSVKCTVLCKIHHMMWCALYNMKCTVQLEMCCRMWNALQLSQCDIFSIDSVHSNIKEIFIISQYKRIKLLMGKHGTPQLWSANWGREQGDVWQCNHTTVYLIPLKLMWNAIIRHICGHDIVNCSVATTSNFSYTLPTQWPFSSAIIQQCGAIWLWSKYWWAGSHWWCK